MIKLGKRRDAGGNGLVFFGRLTKENGASSGDGIPALRHRRRPTVDGRQAPACRGAVLPKAAIAIGRGDDLFRPSVRARAFCDNINTFNENKTKGTMGFTFAPGYSKMIINRGFMRVSHGGKDAKTPELI